MTAEPRSDPSGKTHIPALDGLRGIAVIAVVMVHSFPDLTPELGGVGYAISKIIAIGPFGVDLFFVLSGFLITGILLDARNEPHYFENFYARRALRLFPVYYLYLFVLAVLVPLLHRALHTSMPGYKGSWWWYVSYFANWKSNLGESDPGLDHIWSLAVEEQFYLAWPLVVLLAGRRWLAPVCIALIVQAAILRCVWSHDHVPWYQIYRTTFARYDTMAFGALAALCLRSERLRPLAIRFSVPMMTIGAAVFVALALYAGGVGWRRIPIQTLGSTAASLCFAGLVIAETARSAPPLSAIVLNPLILKYGKYSYFIYIMHGLVMTHVDWIVADVMKHDPAMSPFLSLPIKLASFTVGNVIIFFLAKMSWRHIEGPVLRLKRRFQAPEAVELQAAV